MGHAFWLHFLGLIKPKLSRACLSDSELTSTPSSFKRFDCLLLWLARVSEKLAKEGISALKLSIAHYLQINVIIIAVTIFIDSTIYCLNAKYIL